MVLRYCSPLTELENPGNLSYPLFRATLATMVFIVSLGPVGSCELSITSSSESETLT